MDKKSLENIKGRADQKLIFAKIYLDELRRLDVIGGSSIDRAHQESFLCHLLGTKEAFLIELNFYYDVNLPIENLTLGKLRDGIKSLKRECPELKELYLLERDEESWLSIAKDIRDHSIHISNVPRCYHLGGDNHQKVFLENPKSGKKIEKHFVELFNEWYEEMNKLINRLRISALKNNNLVSP